MKRSQLVRQLLKSDYKNQEKEKKEEILDYVLEGALDHSVSLKDRIQKFLVSNLDDHPSSKTAKVRDFLTSFTIDKARADFYTYAKLMAPLVIPNPFKDGRHIKKISDALQKVEESVEDPEMDTEKLMVFLPPGASKTLLCSILFVSWCFGRHPNWHVLQIGYNDEFASDKIGQPLRELMLCDEYKEIFPDTNIRADTKSKDRFKTTKRGEYYAAGAKARVAGRRAHLLISDDAVSEQDAFSEVERNRINNNYVGGLRSRLMRTPLGAEIVVNTRWHLEDLSGYLLEVDKEARRKWKVICIPAILDEKASEFLREEGDPEDVYQPGTSFWPEFQPLSFLKEEKATLLKTEPHKWHALYMQNPTPQGGNIIKTDEWNYIEDSKIQVSTIIVTFDTAWKNMLTQGKRNDNSAYTVWGIFYKEEQDYRENKVVKVPSMILLGGEWGKWSFNDLCSKVEEVRRDFEPDFWVVEAKQSGFGLIEELYKRGLPVVEFDPRTKKVERLQAASPFFRAGRIYAPANKGWAADIIDEVCKYSGHGSRSDDVVDCVSMAIIWMRDNGYVKHESYDSFGDEEEDEPGWETQDNAEVGFATYWDSLLRDRGF